MLTTLLRLLSILAIVGLASGCATNLQVTYHSEPQGAALYQGDAFMGYTPYTLTYKVTEEDRRVGYKRLHGTSVRWVSGATASISYLTANFSIGYSQVFNFRRPDGVPGYDVDANYALQRQRNAIMMMQTAAQLEQAEAQQRQVRQLELIRQQQQYQVPLPRQTNCTSQVIGNTINTQCY